MKTRNLLTTLALCLSGSLGSGAAMAVDYDADLILEQTFTYNHLVTNTADLSGPFADTGTFTLTNLGSINVSIRDSELSAGFIELLNVSQFSVQAPLNTGLFSTGNLVDASFVLPGLSAGTYTLQFTGDADGVFGGAYDVTVSAVPLPTAAWLFGSALLGFVTYSARRNV
jgi:hypothetical protein